MRDGFGSRRPPSNFITNALLGCVVHRGGCASKDYLCRPAVRHDDMSRTKRKISPAFIIFLYLRDFLLRRRNLNFFNWIPR